MCNVDILLTQSSISLVWAADTHILDLPSTSGVAGYPTTTTPSFRLRHSRLKHLYSSSNTMIEHTLFNSLRNSSWVIEKKRNNWRTITSIQNKTHFFQFFSKIPVYHTCRWIAIKLFNNTYLLFSASALILLFPNIHRYVQHIVDIYSNKHTFTICGKYIYKLMEIWWYVNSNKCFGWTIMNTHNFSNKYI